MNFKRGFTLIELLVVVAIIGILASVVLASLNSARSKGTEAAIKSNLKNMIDQAELAYDAPGNYSTACAGVAGMLTAINNAGGSAACYSKNDSGHSDVNLRWGASAKNSDGSKNWSVDPSGVVIWDAADTGGLTSWDAANTACGAAGGRLPTLEQLKALSLSYGVALPGFVATYYWTSTTVPSISANAYGVAADTGSMTDFAKTGTLRVRCIH